MARISDTKRQVASTMKAPARLKVAVSSEANSTPSAPPARTCSPSIVTVLNVRLRNAVSEDRSSTRPDALV